MSASAVWLCKGQQFADNAANVQVYAPGEVVPIQVDLTIPHVGSANVSVVETATNAVLGQPLLSWPSGYADEREFYAGTTPADQTDFSVTIPDDLGGKCAEAGACVSFFLLLLLLLLLLLHSFTSVCSFSFILHT